MSVYGNESVAAIEIHDLADFNASAERIEALARAAARSFAYRLDYHGFDGPSLSPSEVFELLRDVLSDALIKEPSSGEACDVAGETFRREFTDAVSVVMKEAG